MKSRSKWLTGVVLGLLGVLTLLSQCDLTLQSRRSVGLDLSLVSRSLLRTLQEGSDGATASQVRLLLTNANNVTIASEVFTDTQGSVGKTVELERGKTYKLQVVVALASNLAGVDNRVWTHEQSFYLPEGDEALELHVQVSRAGAMSESALNLLVGATAGLSASMATSMDSSVGLVWSSSNPAVATVDAAGNVLALSRGYTYIRALPSDNGYGALCTVTVGGVLVSFDSQGGSVVAPVFVDAGGLVTRPADPVLDGYVFAGWFTDAACTAGNEWDFATATASVDLTLYAKWVSLATPTPTPTATETSVPVETPTPSPSDSPTPVPSETPTPTPVPGSLEVTISFANPAQPAVSFGGAATVSEGDLLSLAATGGFDSYTWRVNGFQVSSSTSATQDITVSAVNHFRYGLNTLFLLVYQSGVPYSVEFTVTVNP